MTSSLFEPRPSVELTVEEAAAVSQVLNRLTGTEIAPRMRNIDQYQALERARLKLDRLSQRRR